MVVAGQDVFHTRGETTDNIRVATIEGVANCTIGDNPGEATADLWIR